MSSAPVIRDIPPLPDTGFVPVLPLAELPVGQQCVLRIGLNRILLVHSDAGLFAVQDECPHAFQPMAGGRVRGDVMSCPKHGARFCLRTGESRNPLTKQPLGIYQLRVEDGQIELARPIPPEVQFPIAE